VKFINVYVQSKEMLQHTDWSIITC